MSEETVQEVAWLGARGEQAAWLEAVDWSNTPVGSPSTWPQTLRSALSICFSSRFPIAIYWGSELSLLYNEAWSPILGRKHPWALGRAAREVWPEIWDRIGPLFEQVLTTAEATYSEDEMLPMARHGYTEECYFNFTFTPIRGSCGEVAGIFNAVVETTFRVVSERRGRVLRQLSEQMTSARSVGEVVSRAVQSLGDARYDVAFCAIYLCDPAAREARLVSSAGLQAGEARMPERIPLAEKASECWPLGPAARTRTTQTVSDLLARAGAAFPGGAWPEPAHTALVSLIGGAAGESLRFLVAGASPRREVDEAYREFVERAAAQVAMAISSASTYEVERRRADALAELDRAKTAFFSNVSHEFRTPLTLMLGPAEDALADAEEPLCARQRERIELVRRSGLRLQKLVNTLLDFSRLEAGRVQAVFEPLDVASLTADLASSFRSAIERAGLRLIVDCPALSQPVYLDRDLWEKVVLNLLSNALKFTLQGQIRVELREHAQGMQLSVADTGIGIPREAQPRLFERFYRVQGAQGRTHEGSGIGLALVNDLVHLHGGSVRVESELGSGSLFRVELRFGSGHLPQERIRAERGPGPTALGPAPFIEEALRWSAEPLTVDPPPAGSAPRHADRNRARIIVADDNADMREYVARLLISHYEVITVADGRAALEAVRRDSPDLLLADVMMPRLDGFELLQAVRADPRHCTLPVILLSARAGEESRVEGVTAGADDYLVKPFSARELRARVGTHVRMARARREAELRIRSLQDELKERMHDLERLHEATLQLARAETDQIFARVVDAAVELAGADMGNLQLVDPASGTMRIVAQRGFRPEFLDFFAAVHCGEAACGAALEGKDRVVVEDVALSGLFADSQALEVMLQAGARAVQSTPLLNQLGQVFGVFSTHYSRPLRPSERALRLLDLLARPAADLIERAQAQRALRESEERFRVALQSAAIGFAILRAVRGTDGIIADFEWRYANPAALAMLPQPWSELQGRRVLDVLPGIWDHYPEVFSAFVQVVERGQSADVESHSEQTGLWFRNVAAKLDDGLVVWFADETQRKRDELALREADRRKDEFLATLAHELRNPLAPIRSAVELLRLEQDVSPRLARVRDVLDRQTQQLGRLIDDLLEVSRIASGLMQLRKEVVDLAEVVQMAIEISRPLIEQGEHELRIGMPDVPIALVADASRLAQVFSNLLNNAARYTERGGVIELRAESRQAQVWVTVRDNGIGIPRPMLSAIFELFAQVHRSDEQAQGGLGIGLTLAKRLVELHGGRIDAQSEGPGRGSCFTVVLPALEAGARRSAPRPRAQPMALQRHSILVADDNADAAETLGLLLRAQGHHVEVVGDGVQALQAMLEHRPDVALLDLGMPGLSGHDVAREIRKGQRGKKSFLIALTGWGQDEDRRQSAAAGFDLHLLKPVDPVELFRILEAIPRAENLDESKDAE